MELRHIQTFVVVAEELHFGRAATRLKLSQSPVSRAVRELEREVGVELFTRLHHQVKLTSAGEALLPHALALLKHWSDFLAEGRSLAGAHQQPPIRLGSPSLAPAAVLDVVLEALRKAAPTITADVEFASSKELLAAVRAGRLELAVVLLPFDEPDLNTLTLARYELVAVMNEHDELAHRQELTVADLTGRRILMITSALQSATAAHIDTWLREAGAVVEHLPEPDLARLAQLVRHGRGMTLSGVDGAPAQIFRQPGLRLVPLSDDGVALELGLVWSSRVESTPTVRRLLEVLRDVAARGLLRA